MGKKTGIGQPANRKKLVDAVIPLLQSKYPHTQPLLEYENCFQLLIAVILSAQCTDAQVNKVTPLLFAEYPNPLQLGNAPLDTLEDIIHSTGFYKNKARNIREAAALLDRKFNGIVPKGMEDLLLLPGIGRKSANVVRAHCFGLPAIIVDTHFSRVSRRLGIVKSERPENIEKEVAEIVPEKEQIAFSMRINLHGRYVCTSRKPKCNECFLKSLCEFRANRRL